jgi:uncharacterized membrane protein
MLYPDEAIYFGILHCLAASMLIYAALKYPLSRTPAWCGFVICLLLIIFTWNVVHGYVGVNPFTLDLPRGLYETGLPLDPIGFMSPSFRSADYFPLLPYLFVFLAGSFAGRWAGGLPQSAKSVHIPFLAAVGRHSLIIYLLHQPVMIGILTFLS